jgi:single-strand DNA-binding protein
MAEIGVNKVILVGRTGADAEVKYTAGGKAVVNFSLAINESFRNGDGEQKDRVSGCAASRGESWQRSAGST